MQRYDTDRGVPAVKIPEHTSRGLSGSQTPYEVSDEALRSYTQTIRDCRKKDEAQGAEGEA